MNTLFHAFNGLIKVSENRLIYGETPDSTPAPAEAGAQVTPEKQRNAAFTNIEGLKDDAPPTIEQAEKLVTEAMKVLGDKVKEWTNSPDQSDTFKGKAKTVVDGLNAEHETMKKAFTDAGVDNTAPLTAEQLTEVKTFGKKLEDQLTSLEGGAENDKKKEDVKKKVEALSSTYTEESRTAFVKNHSDEMIAKINITDPALKEKVVVIVQKNLEEFGKKSVETLKTFKDGELYKKLIPPDGTQIDTEIPNDQLDEALGLLSDETLFPKEGFGALLQAPEGIAMTDQNDRFLKAIQPLIDGFSKIPAEAGSEAEKAKQAQAPAIENLLKNINEGSASPSDVIAGERQIETAIIIGYLKDQLKNNPELLEIADKVFQTYGVGKYESSVTQEDVKKLLDFINEDQNLKGKINISFEGGADSVEHNVAENRYEKYQPYIEAAKRMLNNPKLLGDKYVKTNSELIKEISAIDSAETWNKFVQDHKTQLSQLKSSTGPFNTILAYMRIENVVGEEGLKDKDISLYLETDATGDAYRYSMLMTYNESAVTTAPVATGPGAGPGGVPEAVPAATGGATNAPAVNPTTNPEPTMGGPGATLPENSPTPQISQDTVQFVQKAVETGKQAWDWIKKQFGFGPKPEPTMGGPAANLPEPTMGGPAAELPEETPDPEQEHLNTLENYTETLEALSSKDKLDVKDASELVSVAAQLSEKTLNLSLTTIDNSVAQELAKFRGKIVMDRLTDIDEESVDALATGKLKEVQLGNLSRDAVLKNLSRLFESNRKGDTRFNFPLHGIMMSPDGTVAITLTEISLNQSEAENLINLLNKSPIAVLDLGITSINENTANALKEFDFRDEGSVIKLNKLTTIDKGSAYALKEFGGKVELKGLDMTEQDFKTNVIAELYLSDDSLSQNFSFEGNCATWYQTASEKATATSGNTGDASASEA